jgi:[ribosomal protein S5]-alanine N-acetyltransferase
MSDVEIQTANLRLVLQTREETLAFIDAMDPVDRQEVSPDWLARVHALSEPDAWLLGFAVTHRARQSVIGNCGYKGPPDADGAVEVAYAINLEHRGQGYATEAAEGLTRYAFSDPRVRIVRAHTIERVNASSRVLTKCGFTYIGEVIEPDDGLVCRWEKHRAAAEPSFSSSTDRLS